MVTGILAEGQSLKINWDSSGVGNSPDQRKLSRAIKCEGISHLPWDGQGNDQELMIMVLTLETNHQDFIVYCSSYSGCVRTN